MVKGRPRLSLRSLSMLNVVLPEEEYKSPDLHLIAVKFMPYSVMTWMSDIHIILMLSSLLISYSLAGAEASADALKNFIPNIRFVFVTISVCEIVIVC